MLHVSSTATVIGFAVEPVRRRPGRDLASRRQGDAERDAAQLADRSRAADPGRGVRARDRDRHDGLAVRPGAPDPARDRERRLAERLAHSGAGDEHASTAAPALPSRLVLPTVPPRGARRRRRSSRRRSHWRGTPIAPTRPSGRSSTTCSPAHTQVRIEETADDRIDETTVVRREYLLVAESTPTGPPRRARGAGTRAASPARPRSWREAPTF